MSDEPEEDAEGEAEVEKPEPISKKHLPLPPRPRMLKTLSKGQVRVLSMIAARYTNKEVASAARGNKSEKQRPTREWLERVLNPITRPEDIQKCIDWIQLRDMAGLEMFDLATPGGCIRQLEILVEDVRSFAAEAKQKREVATFVKLVDCARRCIGYAMSVQTKFGLTKETPKNVEHQTLVIVQDSKSELTSRFLGLMDRPPIPGGALAQLPAPERELVPVERKEQSGDGTDSATAES